MSETAALADLVLPATTFLENWSLDSTPSFDLIPFVSLGQPVIQPLGESRSLYDVWMKMAEVMDSQSTSNFRYENIEDYIKEIVAQIPGFSPDRDFSNLKKNGIWYSEGEKAEYKIYNNGGFNTPSKKIEIAATDSKVSRLPAYEPIPGHLGLAKNELVLIPFHVNVMRPDLANLKWLSEIHYKNSALINSKTARSLKIKTGDKIVIESSVGELKVSAHVSEGVHPEIIAIASDLGHWEYGRIAHGKKFKSEDPDTDFVWWAKKGEGVHPNWVIPVSTDPVGKGQCWMDTKVKVRKA